MILCPDVLSPEDRIVFTPLIVLKAQYVRKDIQSTGYSPSLYLDEREAYVSRLSLYSVFLSLATARVADGEYT